MRIAVGVHVSTYEVTASLVDTTLPELGPIASRTVAVAAAPGGIGGAVSTALGFMRVQAMQNDLDVAGAAVVCENALQREIVADALAELESEPTPVVDIFDERLSDAYTPDVSAALLVGDVVATAAAPVSMIDRRGIWPVAAVGACVLAALGGVTAWAMTATPQAEDATSTVSVVVPTTTPGSVSSSSSPGAGGPPQAPSSAAPPPEVVPGVAAVDVIVVPPVDRIPVPDAPQQNSPEPVRPTSVPTRTAAPQPGGGAGGGTGGGGGGGGSTTTTTTVPATTEPTTTEPTTEPTTTEPAPTTTESAVTPPG